MKVPIFSYFYTLDPTTSGGNVDIGGYTGSDWQFRFVATDESLGVLFPDDNSFDVNDFEPVKDISKYPYDGVYDLHFDACYCTISLKQIDKYAHLMEKVVNKYGIAEYYLDENDPNLPIIAKASQYHDNSYLRANVFVRRVRYRKGHWYKSEVFANTVEKYKSDIERLEATREYNIAVTNSKGYLKYTEEQKNKIKEILDSIDPQIEVINSKIAACKKFMEWVHVCTYDNDKAICAAYIYPFGLVTKTKPEY